MISAISIEGLGVITSARVDLADGLTVVTGETGAGKTMVVTALSLLTGARADASAVRADADRAVVEGIVDISAVPTAEERIADAGGEADDGEAILTRVIPRAGRARATAGGRTVPLGVLRDLGDDLVSMHGQSEQLTLRSQARQRELLDDAAGDDGARALAAYREAYSDHRELTAEAERLAGTRAERAERIAFLSAALEAIDEVRPEPGEDTALASLTARLGAAEELQEAVGSAHALLVGGDLDEVPAAAERVGSAGDLLARAAGADPALDARVEALTDLRIRIEDVAGDLASYLAEFDGEEGLSLDEANERRAALSGLSAYGEDVEAVLAFETSAGGELLALEEAEASLSSIDEALAASRSRLDAAAEELRAARTAAAESFSAAVSDELTALAMPHARLTFDLAPAEPAAHGADDVRLLFSSHAAAEPTDIGRAASGGELSRVMLAVEVVRARTRSFPTFVFDEVDSGVGGAAAVEIGRRLARLAASSQVIVVTHLPQVAAWADHHLVVRKQDDASGAVSGVVELSADGRVDELARMLAGVADSASARAHAAELVESAADEKSRGRMTAP